MSIIEFIHLFIIFKCFNKLDEPFWGMIYLPKEDIFNLYNETHDFGFIKNMHPQFKTELEFLTKLIKENPEKATEIIDETIDSKTKTTLLQMEEQGMFRNSEAESKKQKIQVEENSL